MLCLLITRDAASDKEATTILTDYSYVEGNSLICIQNISISEKQSIFLDRQENTLYKKPITATEELLNCLIQCESKGNAYALNPCDTDGLPAKGILQFKQKTFDYYAPLAGVKEPDIWNSQHQIKTAKYMINIGLVGKWGECTKKCI